MTSIPRDSHSDNDLIDQAEEFDTPSQGGSAGGNLARDIGKRDEKKRLTEAAAPGRDPQPTRVHKSDERDDSDSPDPSNR